MHTLEQEIADKLKLRIEAHETRDTFLQRVVKAINALDQQTWRGLSQDLRDWSNAEIHAVRHHKSITDFDLKD